MKTLRCTICGSKLHGVEKSTTKSKSRPERPFAGVLCHKCTQQVFMYKTRLEEGSIRPEDIDVRYKKYVDQLMGKK